MFENGYYPGGYMNPYANRYNAMTAQQAPKYEVIHVNGENGAQALQMAPNSSVIVMDDTAPMVWLCQTDGAGYKTARAFDITPHQAAPAVNIADIDARLTRLEDLYNAKSDESIAKKHIKVGDAE
nr:MAG TPA: hypothetical protein [Caudoviricetes sp.]